MTEAGVAVVGIGASAGGIEAFRHFFEKMPADSGLAFVVVLHLAASRKSMLAEIISRWTPMPVSEAEEGSPVVANQVLVIPAGAVAELRDGHLALRKVGSETPRSTASIDVFFDSLAASLGEAAIGVILSGTGHDGALGLKAIKARGGLTLAQSGEASGGADSGPEYPGMPDSAVAAGAVDLYAPVGEMPDHILAARDVRRETLDIANGGTPDGDKIRLTICGILRSQLGHDFYQDLGAGLRHG